MTFDWRAVAQSRADQVAVSLARRRLVFLQLGSAFEPIRQDLLDLVPGSCVTAGDLIDNPGIGGDAVIVTELEDMRRPSASSTRTLGALREAVARRLDAGQTVCLVSRVPRAAYMRIPGSSVLEDAAISVVPLLGESELPESSRTHEGWRIPSLHEAAGNDIARVFEAILQEVGTGVLSALDHSLFEFSPRSSEGLAFLSAREIEALRAAGVVDVDADGSVSLVVPNRMRELKDALSDVLSQANGVHDGFAAVAESLWFVERTIRRAVRDKAMELAGPKWRTAVVTGNLAAEVLGRARADTSPSAVSVKELRDPLEWLTLGELLDVACSEKFGGVGMDPVLWRRFREHVVPVRNRLSHMRQTRKDEKKKTREKYGKKNNSVVRNIFK